MTPYTRPVSRRTVLGTAGIAAVALGGLSACGGSSSGGSGSVAPVRPPR